MRNLTRCADVGECVIMGTRKGSFPFPEFTLLYNITKCHK